MLYAGLEETDAELRGDGDRQPGRELQRRRQPDAGAAGRAGRRMGRARIAPSTASSRPTWRSSTRRSRWWRRRSARRSAAAARSRCTPRASRRRPRPTWGWWRSASALIPGGGGCKEMLLRLKDPRKAFELIGFAKVSTSAEDAQEAGPAATAPTRITMNPERLIADAKAAGAVAGPALRARRPAHRHQGRRAKPALRC